MNLTSLVYLLYPTLQLELRTSPNDSVEVNLSLPVVPVSVFSLRRSCLDVIPLVPFDPGILFPLFNFWSLLVVHKVVDDKNTFIQDPTDSYLNPDEVTRFYVLRSDVAILLP